MKDQEINQLKAIGACLYKNQGVPQRLHEILHLIDKKIIDDDAFAYNAYLHNSELFKFRFQDNQIINEGELFDYLYLMEKVCAVYFMHNRKAYNYYIFQEINEIFNFVIRELNTKEVFKIIDANYSLKDPEYHYQIGLYKYEFSILDKITNLLKGVFYQDENIFDENKKIGSVLELIAKDKNSLEQLRDLFFNRVVKSNTYNYLRKLRNSLEHNYLNPELFKNFNLDIYLLFLFCFYVYTSIISNIKTDDQLFDIFKAIKNV